MIKKHIKKDFSSIEIYLSRWYNQTETKNQGEAMMKFITENKSIVFDEVALENG